MFKLTKTLTTVALLSTMAAPGAVFAQSGPLDDGVSACGVPVCDIEATLESLRSLTENQRYNYANELIQTYGGSKSVEVLENLLKTAKKLKDLSIELGDADWVVRTASTLANNALLNLTKYSEIESNKLNELYKQLDSGAKRYEVIAYYQGRINDLEDVRTLGEIVKFAKLAKEHSIDVGDEEWIPRSAEQLASEATIKMVAMDPGHEGIYEIKTKHSHENVLDIDKVVVLDSSSDKNLVVNFINSEHNQVVFSYSGSSIIGDKVEGKLVGNGSMSSKFEFVFDRATGVIEGTIQTTRTKQITFSGKRVFSVGEIYEGSSPRALDENDILGEMEGTILGVKGTLSVQSFSQGVYSASFLSDKGELNVDFTGKFHPKRGVLSLTHKNKIKLVLALRKDGDKTLWRGVSFSTTNGKVSKAAFKPLR